MGNYSVVSDSGVPEEAALKFAGRLGCPSLVSKVSKGSFILVIVLS